MRLASNSSRRGMASLEYVLLFPFLLVMAGALFVVSEAENHKLHVIAAARRDAWVKNPQQVDHPLLLVDKSNLTDSSKDVTLSDGGRTVTDSRVYAPRILFGGNQFNVRSADFLVGGPWDRRNVPYDPVGVKFVPHLKVLGLILANLSGSAGDVLSQLQDLMTKLGGLGDAANKILDGIGVINAVFFDSLGSIGKLLDTFDSIMEKVSPLLNAGAGLLGGLGDLIGDVAGLFGGGDVKKKIKEFVKEIKHALNIMNDFDFFTNVRRLLDAAGGRPGKGEVICPGLPLLGTQ